MQFQVECNGFSLNHTTCLVCKNSFKAREARVIVCNKRGRNYGELCPQCISRGKTWIGTQLQQLERTVSSSQR
jgi:hypothetical protein